MSGVYRPQSFRAPSATKSPRPSTPTGVGSTRGIQIGRAVTPSQGTVTKARELGSYPPAAVEQYMRSGSNSRGQYDSPRRLATAPIASSDSSGVTYRLPGGSASFDTYRHLSADSQARPTWNESTTVLTTAHAKEQHHLRHAATTSLHGYVRPDIEIVNRDGEIRAPSPWLRPDREVVTTKHHPSYIDRGGHVHAEYTEVRVQTEEEARRLLEAHRLWKKIDSENEVHREEALLELRYIVKWDLHHDSTVLHHDREKAIKHCIERINRDRSNWVRCLAARTLGEIAPPHHHAAVTVLSELFERDPSEVMRIGAFQGLATVHPAVAFQALAKLQPAKKALAVEGLIKLTEGKWPWAKAKAAEALGRTARPGDRPAIAALTQLCHNHDESARIHAARSLGKLAHKGDIASIVALKSCSMDRRWEQSRDFAVIAQCAAIDALGKVAAWPASDTSVITILTELSEGDDDTIRAVCLQSLAAIDPSFQKEWAKEELLKLMGDSDVHVRAQAAMAIESIAEPGDTAVAAALATCCNCRGFEEALRRLQTM